MSEATVARRYARALFNIAGDAQAYDKFEQDLKLVNGAVTGSKEVQNFLLHPGIDVKAKKETVKKVLEGKVDQDVLNLILLLIDRSRETIIPELADEYVKMANQARNIVDATVYTAHPLEQNEVAAITEQFGKAIGKTIRMRNEIDDSLIGGMLVRIGDRLYDGSVKGKLFRFKQQLAHS